MPAYRADRGAFILTVGCLAVWSFSISGRYHHRRADLMGSAMAFGGGMTCIKYLLFLFNFIFLLTGIGIIVAGAIIQIRYSNYINFLGDSFLSASILLIAVGCIIAVMGFFGCCGAVRECHCMAMTFAALLGLIFLLELAAGIAGYMLWNELEHVIKKEALDGMSHYNMTGSSGVTEAWDHLQETMHCCGISNYTDWQNSTWFEHNFNVPVSCCEHMGCDVHVRDKSLDYVKHEIYVDACVDKLRDWASQKMGIIIGIICGLAVVQIIGVILSCTFGSRIRDMYEANIWSRSSCDSI